MTEKGILLVDKPLNWTSFNVVSYIRSIIAKSKGVRSSSIKVGHIGTLDPLATGLMVILIGKEFTTRAQSLSKLDKIYEVQAKLGYVTKSFDREFEEEFFSNKVPLSDSVLRALKSFIGESLQAPPIFSAIKINGQRAYQLARSDQDVEIKDRPVNIYYIDKIVYQYPYLRFETKVSSGTYIRSLVNDLGLMLKCGAYLSSLNRIAVGPFKLSDAIKIESLTYPKIEKNLKKN